MDTDEIPLDPKEREECDGKQSNLKLRLAKGVLLEDCWEIDDTSKLQCYCDLCQQHLDVWRVHDSMDQGIPDFIDSIGWYATCTNCRRQDHWSLKTLMIRFNQEKTSKV